MRAERLSALLVEGLRGQAQQLDAAYVRNAVFPLHEIPQGRAVLA
jgi:hypothetical protein